jgi:serine protease
MQIQTGASTRLPISQTAHAKWVVRAMPQGLVIKPKVSGPAADQGISQQQLFALSEAAQVPLRIVRNLAGGAVRLTIAITNANAAPDATAVAIRLNQQAAALNLEFAEPDWVMTPDAVPVPPNDTDFAKQWPLHATSAAPFGLNLLDVWRTLTGTQDIVVAVLDTGVRFEHPDLNQRLLAGYGYDFISDVERANDGDGRDDDASDPGNWVTQAEASNLLGPHYGCPVAESVWHGTQMAGIIGAEANNGYGIAGINWVSSILPVRVLGKCGGIMSDIAEAIRWAAGLPVPNVPVNPRPARVINLSFGALAGCSHTLQDAIDEATQIGAIVVASAGNSAVDVAYQTPANCANVVAVAATDQRGERTYYSNYGSGVLVSAPGGNPLVSESDRIFTSSNSGKTVPQASVTSFVLGSSPAAAEVSGIVSLLLARNPNLRLRDVRALLRNNAAAATNGSCALLGCGAGVVNAVRAVTNAKHFIAQESLVHLPLLASVTYTNVVVQPIQNGNFEAGWGGAGAGWLVYSAKGFPVIVNRANLPGDLWPYSGEFAAWLGGVNDEVNSISQSITLPAGAVSVLVFRWKVQSAETACNHDWATVRVNASSVAQFGLCNALHTNDWPERRIDLSAFAGQTVVLQFRAQNNGSLSSNWFVDDVALVVTPAP